MFIQRLVLKNFRAYRGRFELAFPRDGQGKAVYLLGGENGAGKTSLLLALNLGLYGPATAGLAEWSRRRTAEDAYRLSLEDAFNTAARTADADSMFVEVEFETHGARFEVHREWWFERGALTDEDVRLRLDGAPLTDVDHDLASLAGRQAAAQELMEAVLPARAARFFFFDGEDVASLAERDLGQSVVHGLDELLGLDQVHHLVRELGAIERNERTKLKESASSATLDTALEELRSAELTYVEASSSLQSVRDRSCEVEEQLAEVQAALEDLFEGRDVAGAGHLQVRREAVSAELGEVSRRITTLTAETLGVVASVPGLETVVTRADRSTAARVEAEVESKVRERLEGLAQRLGRVRLDPPLTSDQRARLRETVMQVASAHESPPAEDDVLSPLTLLDLQRLRSRASTIAIVDGLHQLRTESAHRRDLRRQLREIEADLRRFEQSSAATEMLERRQRLESERIDLAAAIAAADVAAAQAEQALKGSSAAVTLAEDALAETKISAARALVARRARSALEKFGKEMRARRSGQLELLVAESLSDLLHRAGALSSVAIDPIRSTVTLRDGAGHEIPVPSAGEKELFALSLIRGLGQLSNREAPMVIDTPLGRLDQAHRTAIVGRFLPTAASQVIVLATDSEIHGDLYATLKPHLAWQATLVPTETGVRIDEGRYFEEPTL